MIVINNSPILLNFNDACFDLNTDTMNIFEKTQIFLKKYPEIRTSLEWDIEQYAKKKKAVRLANKEYEEENSCNEGSVLFDPRSYTVKELEDEIKNGRPQMSVDLIFFFETLRGIWGSISDKNAVERLKDSTSIQVVLAHFGYKVPGCNTIRENVNKISEQTKQLILKCQAYYILENKLDNFYEVFIDSTDVKANTAFPTDIDIAYKILCRTCKSLESLQKFDIPVVIESWTKTRLKKINKHLKYVNMNCGKGIKGDVKEHYRSFLLLGQRVLREFENARDKVVNVWEQIDFNPEKRMALDILWDKIEQDLQDADYVMNYAELRTEKGVNLPTREKILSTSDRDAAYIQKGQRIPVIGYKPQIARSGNGFICGLITPRGNASDSEMLIPVVNHVIKTTNVIPSLVSVDDGYASKDNVNTLENDYKIMTVSISGSKGKKILGEDLWNDDRYVYARNQRSAVESGMFTLKFNHCFGQLRRRGIDNASAELMGKVIAYNFMRIINIEKMMSQEKAEQAVCKFAV